MSKLGDVPALATESPPAAATAAELGCLGRYLNIPLTSARRSGYVGKVETRVFPTWGNTGVVVFCDLSFDETSANFQ